MESCSSDYKESEELLIGDCQNQLKDCLERYKAADNFTPQDMENILGVISFITAAENSAEYIHCAKDAEQNGFFQYAIRKVHLPIIKWLIEKGNIKYHLKKECTDFITFCAEQLLPTIEPDKRETAYVILKAVIEQYKTNIIFQSCKESYLETMIRLQLAHRTLVTQFTIEEELLTPFLNQDQANTLSGLSDMYQTIVDEKGNTLAHIVVNQHDADELYKLINKNCVPKKVENNVHTLAFNKHRVFTKDTTLVSVRPEEAQATRCCYFMLDKYFAENQKDFAKKQDCCKNHSIIKRYDIDSDISRSSSSQSISNSSSSSLQESVLSAPQYMPIPNLSFKSTMKYLSDDDEPGLRNCWKCFDRCYKQKEEDVHIKQLTS
jgi:hypothetical protein